MLLVGLPGSGKSTWAKQQKLPVLSSDAMRLMLAGDETDQSIHKRVFAAIRYLLRQRLEIGCLMTCVDATHLSPWERKPYLALARKYGAKVEAVWFDVPVAECKRRNGKRGRVVPEDVIDRMSVKLIPPSRAEGFSRIRRIAPER